MKGIVKGVINSLREDHMTPNAVQYSTHHPVLWDSTWTYHSGDTLQKARTVNVHNVVTGTLDRAPRSPRRRSVSEWSQCMGHIMKGAFCTEPMFQYWAEKAKEKAGSDIYSLRWVKFGCAALPLTISLDLLALRLDFTRLDAARGHA